MRIIMIIILIVNNINSFDYSHKMIENNKIKTNIIFNKEKVSRKGLGDGKFSKRIFNGFFSCCRRATSH